MGRSGEALWITGIGLSTALGAGREATWSALCRGDCAVRSLEPMGLAGHHGAASPLRAEDEEDPWVALARHALAEALRDAGLVSATGQPRGVDPERAAILLSLSKGGVHALARDHPSPGASEAEFWRRRWQDESWPSAAAALAQRITGYRGPCQAPVAACASGLVAAIQGASWIQTGHCDVALVGAIDASLHPLVLGAFERMRVLARVAPGDDPARAVRPWDRRRAGFLVGEGAAILVLERAEHARARGVLPYTRWAGGALGSSAHHLTDLGDDPGCLARVIRQALQQDPAAAARLDWVHVHGTATRQNDRHETDALRLALPESIDRLTATASKPQIGHLLGAAGAVELAIACLALRDQFAPPTLNLEEPDPECRLALHPQRGRPQSIRAALKLSLGFGGHLAAALLDRVSGGREAGHG